MSNESARTVVIERLFDATPRHLFLAYQKPEHLKRFFGPPGYPLSRCDVDFRVGGRFTFAMTGPSGVENPPFGGTYQEISEFNTIRYSNGFLIDGKDPAPEQQMIVTLTFTARGAQTLLTMTTVFGSQAMHDEHTGYGFVAGTNAALDLLVAHLPALKEREGAR